MKRFIITFSEDLASLKAVQDIFSEAGVEKSGTILSPNEEGAFSLSEDQFVFYENLGLVVTILTETERGQLLELRSITSIEDDIEVKAHGVNPASYPKIFHPGGGALWNMNLVRADWVWHSGQFGLGIKVAVLDTGIADHPNLRTYGGVSFVPGEPDYRDGNGHGTHCAGNIAGKGRNDVFGVAPGAELYSVKVLSSSGTGSTTGVLAGMDWCISSGMNVMSMSLGSEVAPRVSYANAIKKCQAAGIVVVCSSGNGNTGNFPWVGSPANSFVNGDELASPIAVASVDSTKTVATTSSRGTNGPNWNPVTIAAPGVSIVSTHLNAAYLAMSGTSMACPHVAGLAALILGGNPGTSTSIVRALLTLNAENLGVQPAPNEPYGHGLIDCAASVGIASSVVPDA